MPTPILDIISSLSLVLLGHVLRNQLHSCSEFEQFPSMPGNLIVPPRDQPQPQPRIPVELIEAIVDDAADSKACLRSISGTSKLLAMRARPSLFRNIDVLSFRRLGELSSLLSSRHCSIPTMPDRLVIRLETPRLGKTLTYDTESATLDLAAVLEHFDGVKNMVWLDLPMVVGRVDWSYLHSYSDLKVLVLCGTFNWLSAFVTLLGHLGALEALFIEGQFICGSSLEFEDQDYLSPRLKEIALTPSTLCMLRWMCNLRTFPQDLHVVRIAIDSHRSSRAFHSHIGSFLKKYRKISHLYICFEDDDRDVAEGVSPVDFYVEEAHAKTRILTISTGKSTALRATAEPIGTVVSRPIGRRRDRTSYEHHPGVRVA